MAYFYVIHNCVLRGEPQVLFNLVWLVIGGEEGENVEGFG